MENLYSLEFIRNIDAQLLNESLLDPKSSGRYRFYLFDYFDCLTCVTKGDLAQHFGLNSHNTGLSEQYITLRGEGQSKSPFTYDGPLALPFLFCIFIRLFPEGSQEFVDSDFSIPEKSIETLQQLIKEQLVDSNAQLPYEICHQFSAGDFCLVLRTADIQVGYQLASRIRTAQPDIGITFDTYTIVGLEEPRKNQFAKLPEATHQVVLRISTRDHKCLEELRRIAPLHPQGLTGRYDVTITLALEQFQQIYPCLWMRKFGDHQCECHAVTSDLEKIRDPLVKWFYKSHQKIDFINERLLIDLPVIATHTESSTNQENPIAPATVSEGQEQPLSFNEKIRLQNQYIQECQSWLQEWTPEYDYWNLLDEFHKKLSMIQELWSNFSNLRYQRDSYINGNMFFAQMCLMLHRIIEYCENFSAHPLERETPDTPCYTARKALIESGFRDLFSWISNACTSMYSFHLRLQSVNQHSLQSPFYGYQMHMAPGKYLVAYTEFSRLFLCPPAGWNILDGPQYLLPFFSINSQLSALNANPLFLSPYDYNSDQNALIANRKMEEQLLLAINIPDTEHLARIYTINQ